MFQPMLFEQLNFDGFDQVNKFALYIVPDNVGPQNNLLHISDIKCCPHKNINAKNYKK